MRKPHMAKACRPQFSSRRAGTSSTPSSTATAAANPRAPSPAQPEAPTRGVRILSICGG